MKARLIFCSLLLSALVSCGEAPPETNITSETESIIGGKLTTKDHPLSKYVVLIYDNPSKNYCTGLLIKSDVILTAGHCIGKNAKDLTLAFGLKPLNGDYVVRYATKILGHPRYKKANSADRNDLALILIKGTAPADFKVVSLPDTTFPLKAGYKFTAAGYGRISGKTAPAADTQGSGYLRHVDLTINNFNPDETQFYVNQKIGKGICNGDSGGPALMRYKDKDYVVGVASAVAWSDPTQSPDKKDVCAEKSIYMNVKKYRAWIDEALKQLMNK